MPTGWFVPLGVSFLLHGGLLVGLALLPAGREADPDQVTDTRVKGEFHISLARVERPRPRPLAPGFDAVLLPAPVAPPTSPVRGVSDRTEGSHLVRASGPAPGGSGVALASGNATGGGTGSRLFPVSPSAASVVFVIDHSISMGPSGALAAARRELLACLQALTPSTRFQVIPYNKQADPLLLGGRRELVPALPDLIRSAVRQVEELGCEGGTNHVNALRRGLSLQPALLWLITDADDLSLDDVRHITNFNQGRTVLHVIEFSRNRAGRFDNPLERLARANAGTYRRVHPDRVAEDRGREVSFEQPAR
jgi:hypothetical protein